MNEKLTERMVEWVSKTAETIGDFAAKEIPPFINEYLTWKFYEAAFGAACAGFVLLLCVIFWVFFLKKLIMWGYENNKASEGFVWLPVGLSSVASVALFFSFFPRQEIKDMIQIRYAPKVYLLEKAGELYKESKK